jgi:hypothetical protein
VHARQPSHAFGDLALGHDHDLVEREPADEHSFVVDLAREAVGQRRYHWYRRPPPARERRRHRVRHFALHADDPDVRRHRSREHGDPAGQPAAADGHDERTHRRQILEDLESHRSLAGEQRGSGARAHVHHPVALRARQRGVVRRVVIGLRGVHLGTHGDDPVTLHRRRRRGDVHTRASPQ